MDNFYYTFILLSEKDGKKYTGYTSNLPLRFEANQSGKVHSTKHRRPLNLIYFEACLSEEDAIKKNILKHIMVKCTWQNASNLISQVKNNKDAFKSI